MKFLMRLISLILLLASSQSWARTGATKLGRHYGPHQGYLQTTEGERDRIIADMVVIQPPKPIGPSLHDRIFNEKLSREFTQRYEDKFGRTEEQRIWNSSNRNTYYDDLYGFQGSVREDDAERRRFGNFMIKRLTEYHVEDYAKSEPSVRPVWEAKERLSNVKIQAGPYFKMRVKYSLSANATDVNIENPWVETRVTLLIGGEVFKDAIVSLSRKVTDKTTVETNLKTADGIVSLIGRRTLTPSVTGTLTTSTYTHNHGTSVRENLYLAGVAYVF